MSWIVMIVAEEGWGMLKAYNHSLMTTTIPTPEEVAQLYKTRKSVEKEMDIERNNKIQQEIQEDNAHPYVITLDDLKTSIIEAFREAALTPDSKNSVVVDFDDILKHLKRIGRQRLGRNPYIPRHLSLLESVLETPIPGWTVGYDEEDFDGLIMYFPEKDCCLLM